MQALTYCNTKVMSTRTTAGQFKSQFKGAMERYTGFDSQESSPTATTQITKVSIPVGLGRWTVQVGSIREEALTPPCHDTPQNSERTSGAMEDMSRQGKKANTHIALR